MMKSLRTGVPVLACVMAALFAAPAARADDETSPLATLRAYSEAGEEASPAAEARAPEVAPSAPSTAPTAATASARDRMLPLIHRAAQDNDIPASLLDAVVRVESRYNPNVKNRGAIGLMQIKLATARGIGFSGDAAALSRPETNLQWGAKYLARAYHLSRGDTCLTLARYQGGHGVDKMSAASKAYCAKVRTVLAQLD